jgi:hypothetical protein
MLLVTSMLLTVEQICRRAEHVTYLLTNYSVDDRLLRAADYWRPMQDSLWSDAAASIANLLKMKWIRIRGIIEPHEATWTVQPAPLSLRESREPIAFGVSEQDTTFARED